MEIEGNSKWLKWAAAGLAGLGVCTAALKEMQTPRPRSIDLGGLSVSVHLATLNEESQVRGALESLNGQNLRSRFRLVLLDSRSEDRTVDIASPLVDGVLCAPRGKLSARNYGFEADPADIIVAADADSVYPRYWLDNLLEPFGDPGVVAAHGPRFSKENEVLTAGSVWYNLARPVTPHFSGGNSAIRRDAFWAAGGFDASAERDWDELNLEEEFRFPRRLGRVGRVAYAWGAGCYASSRYILGGRGRAERMGR